MLFNSYEFIFLFLPVVFFGYFILSRYHKDFWPARIWLLASSLFFYCHWDIIYLPLILFSIGTNYLFSYLITEKASHLPVRKKVIFIASLAFNIGLLGFFKYADFFIEDGQLFAPA